MLDTECDDCRYTNDSDRLDNESEIHKRNHQDLLTTVEEHGMFTILTHCIFVYKER